MLNKLPELTVFNCITFLSSTHKYFIDNAPGALISVTGLLGLYKEKFDKEKWSAITAKKQGTTPDVIKSIWDLNTLYSTTKGTMLHNYIENFYNNKVVQYNKEQVEKELGTEEHLKLREEIPILIKQFNNFYNDHKHILPVKSEFPVGDIKGTKVCGMLDMLAYNIKNDTFEIYDYKTNKDIRRINSYNKYMLPPLEHLFECEYNTYSLQLSIYKYFIEKYTSIKIDKLNVIWFNQKNDDYEVINLDYLGEEVELILNDYLVDKLDKIKVNKEAADIKKRNTEEAAK
jgi:hypothetical protein